MALFAQAPAGAASAPTASVENNEVWIQTPSGRHQLTHDGVPKRSPVLSPSADDLAYAVDKDVTKDPPKEEIVLMNMRGEIIRHIIPEDYFPTSSEELSWIDNSRIGILGCGHASCMYWILDAGSGKTIQIMRGGFDFIWSHNRQFVARHVVAYYGDAPPGEPAPEHDAVLLNQDSVFVYPPGSGTREFDNTQSHDIGRGKWPPFVWSPNDNWVAFADMIGPEYDSYVVLVSPTGGVSRETVPVDIGFDATISWQDDTHLELHTGGKTFKFVINGKQLSEVKSVR